jgi:hypothetical protein
LRLATLLLALLVSGCPDANEPESKGPTAVASIDAAPEKPKGKHAGQSYDQISYENSNDGLRRLMRDLKTGILADDEEEVAVLLASLRLEDDKTYFKSIFGDKLGAKLSAKYRPHREEIGVLAKYLRNTFEDGLSTIETYSFSTAGVDTATGYQNTALELMENKVPLYSVRFMNSDQTKSFHLWSFVHFEGSFRYVGKLTDVGKANRVAGLDLNELRVQDANRVLAQEK